MIYLLWLWATSGSDSKKSMPAVKKTWVQSLCWEDPLEKEMATHSSILAWRIPGTCCHKESDMTEWLHFHFGVIIWHFFYPYFLPEYGNHCNFTWFYISLKWCEFLARFLAMFSGIVVFVVVAFPVEFRSMLVTDKAGWT